MGMYSHFKTDPEVEKSGVWLDYEHLGFRVLVTRAGGTNVEFKKLLNRKLRPHKKDLDNLPPDVDEKITREIYAEVIIRDWATTTDGGKTYKSGLENPKGGELLPFTQDNVKAALKALPDLFVDIQNMATNIALFRADLKGDDAKN